MKRRGTCVRGPSAIAPYAGVFLSKHYEAILPSLELRGDKISLFGWPLLYRMDRNQFHHLFTDIHFLALL